MSDSVEIEKRREEIAAALRAEGIDLDVLDQMDTEVVLERIWVALAKHDVAKYWVSLPFSFSFLVHLDLYTVSGGGDTPHFVSKTQIDRMYNTFSMLRCVLFHSLSGWVFANTTSRGDILHL